MTIDIWNFLDSIFFLIKPEQIHRMQYCLSRNSLIMKVPYLQVLEYTDCISCKEVRLSYLSS